MSSASILIELLSGKVFKVRNQTIVLDFDAAVLYDVNMAVLHKAVTKYAQRFPTDFIFWLTDEEWKTLADEI